MRAIEQDKQGRPRTVGDALSGLRVSTAIAVLGLVVVAAGSVGPWVDSVVGSAGGLRGDGVITLSAAGIALLGIALGRGQSWARAVAGIAAVIAMATAGYDFVHIRQAAAGATLFGVQVADVGWGPIAVLCGAAAALVGLVAETRSIVRLGISGLAVGAAVGTLIAGAAQQPQASAARSAPSSVTDTSTDTTPTDTTTDTTTTAPAPNVQTTSGGGSPGSYSGVAPASSIGPATGQSACPGVAATVGANTSCGFAANVFHVVQQAHQATGQYPAQVNAASPATGQTYQLHCNTASPGTNGPNELECATGTGAEVTVLLPLR